MPNENHSINPIEKDAFRIIEKIINNITFDENEKNHQSEDFIINSHQKQNQEAHKTSYLVEKEEEHEIKNIQWPKISEFNETIAIAKIDEFIKNTWQYDECWLYCIDFIEKIEKQFTNLFNFRVRWSIPTRRKPIPRFTASVYFTFDVSKIKPTEKSVDVYYIFETQKLIHKPGLSRFRQEWLNDIISLKENLIKECKF